MPEKPKEATQQDKEALKDVKKACGDVFDFNEIDNARSLM